MNRLIRTCVSFAILVGASSVTYAQPHILQRIQARTSLARPYQQSLAYVPVTIVSQPNPTPTQSIVVREPIATVPEPVQAIPVATPAKASNSAASPSDVVFGAAANDEHVHASPVAHMSHVSPTTVSTVGTTAYSYRTITASPTPVVTSTIVPVPVIITNSRRPILARQHVYPVIAPVAISLGR